MAALASLIMIWFSFTFTFSTAVKLRPSDRFHRGQRLG
jgi:hypothetical protein